MVNKELQSVLDFLEREKGLEREVLIETIRTSLESAARKSISDIRNPEIEIDPETLEVSVHDSKLVVSDDQFPKSGEIILAVAKEFDPQAKPGTEVKVEVTPDDFGRIAAQTAKQVIIQKIRDAQSEVIFNEYKDRSYQVINGVVRQSDSKNIVLDLGRGEAVLRPREQIENEEYRIGDRLKVLVLEVKKGSQSPEIVVSRSHPLFVKKLFEIEVPEIADGTVEIKGIAREAGYRTKIAVHSTDSKVDCVGACVGMRGTRVKNIVQELNGEKIDIVPWSDDITTFCRNAMNPAKLKQITEEEDSKKLKVYVDKSQFSLAIGKKGHNARLTSKLIGWKIDIEMVESEEKAEPVKKSEEKKSQTEDSANLKELNVSFDSIEALSKKVKEYLHEAGYATLDDLKDLSIDELYSIPGIGKSAAEEIMDIIRRTIQEQITKS